MHRNRASLWIGVACLFCSNLLAQQSGSPVVNSVPRLVKFSGVVKDTAGKAQTGPVSLTFSLYNEEGVTEPLWREAQEVQLDEQGRYTTLLGASSADGLPLDLFTSNEARWLGVQVGNEAEQQPRVLLVSVPYALKAGDAATLGGKPASAFALIVPRPDGSAKAPASTTATTTSKSSSSLSAAGSAAPATLAGMSPQAINAGFIAEFGDDTGTLTNAPFFDLNGNVGLGTMTPAATLDINGSLSLSGSNSRIVGDMTNPTNANRVLFQTSATDGLTIVGALPNGAGAGAAWAAYSASDPDNASLGQLTVDASTAVGIRSLATGTGTTLPISVQFGSPPTEVMRVTPSGNVGIGTATPTASLDVAGNVKIEAPGAGITFPDGTSQTTAAVAGVSSLTAGAGVSVSSPTGNVTVGIANGGVNTVQLAAGAVTGANIATGTVTGDNIASGTITGANIAAGSTLGPTNRSDWIASFQNTNTGSGSGVDARAVGGPGVLGFSVNNWGVRGESTTNNGVQGLASAPNTSGVSGRNDNTAGYGVFGFSTNGWGVRGDSTTNNGVQGLASAPGVSGVSGRNDNAAGYGVHGFSLNGAAVHGISANGPSGDFEGNGAHAAIGDPHCGAGSHTVAIGFLSTGGLNCAGNFNLGASTTNKETVINRPLGGQISFRENNGPDQMRIASGGFVTIYQGVLGSTNSTTDFAAGVKGEATANTGNTFGVVGSTNSTTAFAAGVRGAATANTGNTSGVFGSTNSTTAFAAGVKGLAGASTGETYGVYGESRTGSLSGAGVYGTSGNYGVEGVGSRVGVIGGSNSDGGIGVIAQAGTGTNAAGVVGRGANGTAGYFSGNVQVTGTLSKGGGAFKIDHPLDPANKYLYHSFVESPDMKNIYDGVVVLDENGESVVQLPEWFEALNKDFRYQLTAIGAPGPNLYIAEEIANNRFTIAGGGASMKVSWQVTGIRQDAWANAHRIQVEEEKPAEERGFYLHPTLFGAPEEKEIEWAHHPELMRQMKERSAESSVTPTRP